MSLSSFLCGKCRALDTSSRRKKFLLGGLVITLCIFLLLQRETGNNNGLWSNHDLLLALGRQGSAVDVHGHRFKYLGIDGKWIPVSESPTATDAQATNPRRLEKHRYHLEQPARRDYSRGQSLVIDKLLNHKVNGFFLDIGAGDGETDSITLFFEKWRRWTGLLVEPDEEMFEFIQSKNRKAEAWQTCVRTSNMTYFRGKEPCVSITDVLNSIDTDTIDLLTVNVRGHAYDIIKGINLSKTKVNVLSVEFEQVEERSVEYNQMTKHLHRKGYLVKHILIEKHLHKMDVIYMRTGPL